MAHARSEMDPLERYDIITKVASFIERRTPQFENYNSTRPLIQKANEYFEPRGANLLGKL